ncbi:MAG: diadenylate cyclase CdaA [Oscillospiraceae bacterium]|nr:diadenylate cyclase CdaA [Oscillospiraceae bacterium]
MDTIRSILTGSLNYLKTIGFADAVDILIVAYLIYKAIELIRRTNSFKLAKGIIVLLLVLWLSGVFKLTMINYLLRKAVELGLIAIVIIFQPELRKLLEKMGSGELYKHFTLGSQQASAIETAITQTVLACTAMSASRTGALIVFERANNLSEYMRSGTVIDSNVNSELLKNLFYDKAPLHDGAVIVREGRIEAAGCVLPLSKSNNLSKDLGMRHRAGIGMSEAADAVVVIVSEETGSISVAQNGMLKRHLTPATFETLLRTELLPAAGESEQKKGLAAGLQRLFKGKKA